MRSYDSLSQCHDVTSEGNFELFCGTLKLGESHVTVD